MSAAQPYRVAYGEKAKASIRDLLKRAAGAGISERGSRTLREIEGRLELDPAGWGDPFRHLRHAKITLYRRVYEQVNVEYGVHDTEPSVWVTLVEVVLGHPLKN